MNLSIKKNIISLLFIHILYVGNAFSESLDLFFVSDLNGHFIEKNCESSTPVHINLLALKRAWLKYKEQYPHAISVGGAGLLGKDVLARYLMSHESGSTLAASLMNTLDFSVYALGVPEFAMPPEQLLIYIKTLHENHKPVVLSNIKCDPKEPFCAYIKPYVIQQIGTLKVGFVGFIRQDLKQHVNKGHVPGDITSESSLALVIQQIRHQVDIVVLLTDIPEKTTQGSIALIRELEKLGAHVDLSLAAGMAQQNASLSSIEFENQTRVVGSYANGQGFTAIHLSKSQDSSNLIHTSSQLWAITQTLPSNHHLSEEQESSLSLFKQQLLSAHEHMCQSWGQEIIARTNKPLSEVDTYSIILDAMREIGHADVSFVNRRSLNNKVFPLSRVNQISMTQLIPYPSKVVVVEVNGSQLATLAGGATESSLGYGTEILTRGLQYDPQGYLVNGRLIDSLGVYRVALTDYLASGGDKIMNNLEQDPKAKLRIVHEDIRQNALDYMRKHTINGTTQLLKLGNKPAWKIDFNVNANILGNFVKKGEDSTRSQLQRPSSVNFSVASTTKIQMLLPMHRVEFNASVNYARGLYMSQDPVTNKHVNQWFKTADLVNVNMLYNIEGLFKYSTYVPAPSFTLGIESEFEKPDTRKFHHLELSATGGAIFQLFSKKLTANIGLGIRKELLASKEDEDQIIYANTRFLLLVTVAMPTLPLLASRPDLLLLNANTSYAFSDPILLRNQEFKAALQFNVNVGGPLYISTGFNAYVYKENVKPLTSSFDVLLGINVMLNQFKQMR